MKCVHKTPSDAISVSRSWVLSDLRLEMGSHIQHTYISSMWVVKPHEPSHSLVPFLG